MGMQSASIQQSPNPSNGKGMGQQPTNSGPQGDYGDPNFDNSHVMQPRFASMANQLMGGQYTQGSYNGGQFDPSENGGLSSIPNTQQYAPPAGGPPMNQQPNPSMNAPAVMPSRQQPMGKGGRNVTMPSQGGQPRMGMPNAYSNTIQPWDNASIQPQNKSGKGKGY